MKKVFVLFIALVMLLSVSLIAVFAEEVLEIASVESDADYPGGGYPVENLIDGINGTFWIGAENAKKSELTFTFANIMKVDRIRTFNMYSMDMTAYALVGGDWVEVGKTLLAEYNLDEASNTYGHDIIFDATVSTYKIKLEVDKADSSWNQPQGGQVRFYGEATSEAAPVDSSPATADSSLVLWIAIIVLSGALIIVLNRKRVTN